MVEMEKMVWLREKLDEVVGMRMEMEVVMMMMILEMMMMEMTMLIIMKIIEGII